MNFSGQSPIAAAGTLDTAAARIARDGAVSVSLRRVAAAAGTSTTAVYSLFGGKAELLTAVLDDGFASFAAAQQEASSAGLETLGRAYRTWALEHPVLYGLMFGGSLASRVPCPYRLSVASSYPHTAELWPAQRDARSESLHGNQILRIRVRQ